MALRPVPAKGIAIATIGGMIGAATLLRTFPAPPASDTTSIPERVIAARALGIGLVTLREASDSVSIAPQVEPRPEHAPVRAVDLTRVASAQPDPIAARRIDVRVAPRHAPAESQAPRVLARSIDIAPHPMPGSGRSSIQPESRRPSAVSRAMSTAGRATTDAFRVAGTSVGSAFRRVF